MSGWAQTRPPQFEQCMMAHFALRYLSHQEKDFCSQWGQGMDVMSCVVKRCVGLPILTEWRGVCLFPEGGIGYNRNKKYFREEFVDE